MFINRGMDKEDVVYIYNETSLSHKMNEIGPFATMWMDLETHIVSCIYINDLVYKAERDTDIENKCMDTTGESGWSDNSMNWEIEIDVYTLLCVK